MTGVQTCALPICATGIGWALGVGRLGSILGPTVGGILLAQAWAPNAILQVSAWPALVAAIAVFVLGRVVARRDRRIAETTPVPARA